MEKKYLGYSKQYGCPIMTSVNAEGVKTVYYCHFNDTGDGLAPVYKLTPPAAVAPKTATAKKAPAKK